jgi:hypothetical protein
MKLGWGILTLPNALWVKVLRSKYMREEVGLPQPVAKSGDSPLFFGKEFSRCGILKGTKWLALINKQERFEDARPNKQRLTREGPPHRTP